MHDAHNNADVLLQLSAVARCFSVGGQVLAILQDVNLTIHRGELLAIMGQSGSGKSTLMNILGCLDRPSSGTYRIDGLEVGTLSGDQLARLRREHFGFIFQRYHLLPHLSAAENVEIPAIYAGVDKASRRIRSHQLLERLGLTERVAYQPSKLSGGQQQRVSIARALMNGGEVILADEPTGALDTQSGREVMNILLELHQLGHTVIIVTHDAKVADYAHRIIELRDGRIVADRPHTGAADNEEVDQTTHRAAGTAIDSPRPQRWSSKATMVAGAGQRTRRWWHKHLDAMNLRSLGAALKMAWIAMVTHRMRTLLTMLGIIIGITAVVTVVALGQGAQQSMIDEIQAFGTNTIAIYPGSNWGDDTASSIHTLLASDLALLAAQFYTDSVTPTLSSTQTLLISNIKASALVQGVSEQYFRVRGVSMAAGAGFKQDAVRRRAQVAVIDDNTRKRLFKAWEQPIGKTILIGALPCTVIGVIAKPKNLLNPSSTLNVFIPYTTAADRLTGRTWFDSVTVRVRDGIPNKLVEQNITKLMTTRHSRKDFFTDSSDAIIESVKKMTGMMTLFVMSIAVISLLVGGVGVMNIMLVSVTERTHEIGIRMAVGARQSDIMRQFLIEAVLVCLAGGLFGIVLSFAIGGVFSLFVQAIAMRFSMLSIVLACTCSMLIGIGFGFWPARNAARLDPIDALARE